MTKSMDNICTNCGKENKGVWIASPTINKKRRNQCLACAEKELSMESRFEKQAEQIFFKIYDLDLSPCYDKRWGEWKAFKKQSLKIIKKELKANDKKWRGKNE